MEKKRVGLLDEVRGFAILCMVVYHFMYTLHSYFGFDVPIFFTSWFDVIRDIFAGTFIFVSGVASQYSRNNMKRGILCFFIGMVITFVTAIAVPNLIVVFGILHFLGISMMIFGVWQGIFDKIPPFIGVIACVLLYILTMRVYAGVIGFPGLLELDLPSVLYKTDAFFPLGMHSSSFFSSDYFPIFPWIFVFLGGAFFGVYVKENAMPRFFYNTRFKFLATVGRYTLWIYVLHQPVIFLILTLIFGRQ